MYKKCFKNCKYCYGKGNETVNNCKECKENFTFINDSTYNTNCYQNCDFYYFFDEFNNFQCTETCPEKYNKLIKEKNKCVENCVNDDIYKYEYNNTCYNYQIKNKNSKEIIKEIISSFINEIVLLNETLNNDSIDLDIHDRIQEKIKNIIKHELDINTLNDGKDIKINVGSINYTITTTNNQKKNNNNDSSIIDLSDCEYKLKEVYNISKNDSLYIFKVDLIIEQIHIVEYEVYYPFLSNNATILNLSICKDMKIDMCNFN